MNMQEIRALPVPVPQAAEASVLGGEVERALNAATLLALSAASASSQVPKLEKSILAKAFRGELVGPETRP